MFLFLEKVVVTKLVWVHLNGILRVDSSFGELGFAESAQQIHVPMIFRRHFYWGWILSQGFSEFSESAPSNCGSVYLCVCSFCEFIDSKFKKF